MALLFKKIKNHLDVIMVVSLAGCIELSHL